MGREANGMMHRYVDVDMGMVFWGRGEVGSGM